MSDETVKLYQMLAGENREAAASELVRKFMNQLLRLIRVNLSPQFRQRVDEQDILQSVWRSFFDAEFEITDSDQLFGLLATICVNKSRDAVRRQTAEKRDVTAESDSSKFGLEVGRRVTASNPLRVRPGHEHSDKAEYEHESLFDEDSIRLLATGAQPEHALLVFELLEDLDPELRAVLVLRMQNMSKEEIASELGVSVRTVGRRIGMLRLWMMSVLEDRIPENPGKDGP